MTYARIIGTGSYLPEKILTNADLEKKVDTTDEWIVQRTGIKRRHIAADNETAGTMAFQAASKAIEAANITAQDIDLIIVATCTPDYFFPSVACLLQEKLDIQASIPAFDLSAACAGFIYSLSVADQFIKTGAVKNALVVGSEVMSRTVDWTDRRTCILFGDGAGAVVVQANEETGIHSTHLHAQGQYKDLLYSPNNLVLADFKADNDFVHMRGPEVLKFVVGIMGDVVNETLAANNMSKSDIDWLVPHQANFRIIKAIAKKLNMSMEQIILTIEDHANTSSASIPLALDVAVRDGRIKRGDNLLIEGFGGGMAWGSALITY